MTEKPIICVAVDIEKTGAFLTNPVVSVGFYIANLSDVELQKRKFNIEVKWPVEDNYGDFEPRCWKEFWSKQPSEIINRCKRNPEPLPAFQAWREIGMFIDSLETLYPPEKYTIQFISDNPSFDIASIDYNLEKYTGRMPMRYSRTGKYRSVIAADDMFEMLPSNVKSECYKTMRETVNHDHDPINDAHHIFLQYYYAKNMV